MKIPFYISVGASAVCLVLSIVLLAVGGSNQGLQSELQKQQEAIQAQQEQINAGNQISQQLGPALLKDMITVSAKNEKMRSLLAKHGYNVTFATPTPSPGGTPKP